MKRISPAFAILSLTALLAVSCGGGDEAVELPPIGGVYQTTQHLVNPTDCSQDGSDHASTPLRGAPVSHDEFFKVEFSAMSDRWELEWCPDSSGSGCSFSLFSVEQTSGGWFKENAQAGGQSGFDCENTRQTYTALLNDDGTLRLEYRIYIQALPEGDPQCNLAAAQALEADVHCAGFEVIEGRLVSD